MIRLDNISTARQNLLNAIKEIVPGIDEFAILHKVHDGLQFCDTILADIELQFGRRLQTESEPQWMRCPCGASFPNNAMFSLHAKTCPHQRQGYLPGQNVGLPPSDVELSANLRRLPPGKP